MPAAPIRIVIVVAVSILGLIGLVVREGMARDAGTEVAMTMQPVDPQTLLSGHYVTVALGEVLGADQSCPPGTVQNVTTGPTRWVALAPRSGHYSVAGVAATQAEARKIAPLTVKGDASCFALPPSIAPQITADLGVTRFHVSEAQAARIGDLVRTPPPAGQTPPVLAVISVGQDGVARMKGLVVNGQRLMLTWF
jgi:uncharacterized membrane-anchored protein